MYFVYILQCGDGSYYVGSTQDLTARVEVHNAGKGPVYTACRRPVTLVYSEVAGSLEDAISRERQVKRWSHAKKDALIGGDLRKLNRLAKCRRAVTSQ